MNKKEARENLNKDIEKFLEAGGKITKVGYRQSGIKSTDSESKPKQPVDMKALPETLKIRFGIR